MVGFTRPDPSGNAGEGRTDFLEGLVKIRGNASAKIDGRDSVRKAITGYNGLISRW